MHWTVLSFAFLLTLAVPASAQVPGSYRLTICNRLCEETDSGVVRGNLVIFPDSITLSAFDDSTQKALSRLRSTGYMRPVAPNACFAITHRQKTVDGKELYAGIIRNSLTRARSGPTGVVTTLYSSPDASYSLIGYFKSGKYAGEGHQVNCCGGAPPTTFFLAVRTGEPDIQTCL
jgi:hypothetical protein